MNTIYFDHNATTSPAPEVLKGIPEWITSWGNPSSIHQMGRGPKSLMRWVRTQISQMVGSEPLELVFTAGGSESNNLAIKGVFYKLKNTERNHYLFSRIEHPSVLKTAQFLVSQGAEVEFIEVNRRGEIDLEDFARKVRLTTALVSVMLANNETGAILPIKKMAKIAHEKGALFHTDAVQALGKMLFSVRDLGVDLASFSGHKFYALKGAGVLYIKRGTTVESLIHGGGQERSRRAGTENLLALAALASQAEKLKQTEQKITEIQTLRDELESQILHRLTGITINGKDGKRLCNTSSMVLEDVDGETLLMNLDMEGACVSTGAACSSGSQEPSPSLRAMGLTREEAQSSLRISLGWNSTREEVMRFCDILEKVVIRIRQFKPELKNPQQVSL